MIIRNENSLFKDGVLNEKVLLSCLNEHSKKIARYKMLEDYYNGNHAILNRERKDVNNKVVVNHAEYITDFLTAYFGGNPIKYIFKDSEKTTADEKLEKAFKLAHIDYVDTEIIRNVSIYGLGYELTYQDRDGITKSASINPKNCFLVCDDTVEKNELIGVHINAKYDDDGREIGQTLNVYTNNKELLVYDVIQGNITFVDIFENVFDRVPIIEYTNKVNQKGDFEGVIGLIDAYNLLQSDRINDKEQFVNALLVIYGMLAGDTTKEKMETAKALKRLGMLEMDKESRAEFITKTFQESDIELLRKSIEADIHKISKVPNMTDESFAGNASGVAMAYKLLGLEQLAQTKESYYRIGIDKRLRLYASVLKIKEINANIEDIELSFTRSLPVNMLEISQLIVNLKDFVSQQTLLGQIPFIENIDAEIERVNEQKQKSFELMQNQFGNYNIQDKELDDEEANTK